MAIVCGTIGIRAITHILIDTMLKATTKVRDKALQQMRNKLNSIINGSFWTAANLARDMVRVDQLGLRQSMRQWIMDDLDLLTIKARMIEMPRLTEVRKNAINTFDADYATMCHRLNEPDEQDPSSNQPQLRGQVNALGWEREDEHHHQKNVLGLAQDARHTTFSNENSYNDYNNYQGGKGWKRKYHWRTNPMTSATTISLLAPNAERKAKDARVAKRTTIRTDKLD